MATLGNNAETFLNGLSSFWTRLFKDIGDIQALYEGSSYLFGQAYLNLLSDVLNISLTDAPLFKKEYYKSIVIKENDLIYDEDTHTYNAKVDPSIVKLSFLVNTIFNPSLVLDANNDYSLVDGILKFKRDPTNTDEVGRVYRDVEIPVNAVFSDSTIDNWANSFEIKKGDYICIGLDPESLNVKYDIILVKDNLLYLNTPTNISAGSYYWQIVRRSVFGDEGQAYSPEKTGVLNNTTSVTVKEVAFWAMDCLIEENTLYNTFGYLFTDKKKSSEVYRAYLKGLMQLYAIGPTIDRIESALNLVAGFDVIKSDNETLLNYDSGILQTGVDGLIGSNIFISATGSFTENSIGKYINILSNDNASDPRVYTIVEVLNTTHVRINKVLSYVETNLIWNMSATNLQTVTTSENIYTYPHLIPLRLDVKNPSNYGNLKFRTFEILTTAIIVTDYIKEPNWWYNILLPNSIWPDQPSARRLTSPSLFPNTIGPASNAFLGDPGFKIGADEYGRIGTSDAPPFRHVAAFILMDQFFKLHTFGVRISSEVDRSGSLIRDMQNMLHELKPVHSFIYFQPITSFTDLILLSDYLANTFTFTMSDSITLTPNNYKIGATWGIGLGFKYVSNSIVSGMGSDYNTWLIGGPNPGITSSGSTAILDSPVHIKVN